MLTLSKALAFNTLRHQAQPGMSCMPWCDNCQGFFMCACSQGLTATWVWHGANLWGCYNLACMSTSITAELSQCGRCGTHRTWMCMFPVQHTKVRRTCLCGGTCMALDMRTRPSTQRTNRFRRTAPLANVPWCRRPRCMSIWRWRCVRVCNQPGPRQWDPRSRRLTGNTSRPPTLVYCHPRGRTRSHIANGERSRPCSPQCCPT